MPSVAPKINILEKKFCELFFDPYGTICNFNFLEKKIFKNKIKKLIIKAKTSCKEV